ncbi:MAG: CoA-transferase, partial [Bacillota bacterium]
MKPRTKVSTLAKAVSEVKSGMTIFVDGFGYNRTPMAAVHELIRQGPRDLCIIGSSEIQADMLIGAGCVSRIDNGWTGAEGWPHGSFSSYPMRRKMESGELKVEYYTN